MSAVTIGGADLRENGPFLIISSLGVLYVTSAGSLYTIKDGVHWQEIGPLPDSDREEELRYLMPEADDEVRGE